MMPFANPYWLQANLSIHSRGVVACLELQHLVVLATCYLLKQLWLEQLQPFYKGSVLNFTSSSATALSRTAPPLLHRFCPKLHQLFYKDEKREMRNEKWEMRFPKKSWGSRDMEMRNEKWEMRNEIAPEVFLICMSLDSQDFEAISFLISRFSFLISRFSFSCAW